MFEIQNLDLDKLNLEEDQKEKIEERINYLINTNILPERQATVYVLAKEEGIKNEKIAKALNINEGTVKSHLNKIREKIKDAKFKLNELNQF